MATKKRPYRLACLLLVVPGSLAAQTVIRVESVGLPVAGAEVAIWDAEGRVGLGRTAGLGIVRIIPERALGAEAFLLVRRLGFVPVRLPYHYRDSLTISLAAVLVRLPVLSVDAKPLRCPAASDPAAEDVWRTTASHYTLGAVRLRIEWTGYRVNETVVAEQRGYGDSDELRPQANSSFSLAHGEALMIQPPPYALFEHHVALGGEFSQWRYAAIDGFSAEHFVSERFRERHTFTVLGRSGSSTLLGFCARDYSEAEIQGELQVDSDSLLTAARWFFRVPHDDEDAGGESSFALWSSEGHAYLVAFRGSFWRRAGRNLYSQTRFERLRWQLRSR